MVNTFVLHKYVTETIRRVVTSLRARRSANLLILWLSLSYLLIVPTVISSDQMTIGVFSLLWIPQIIQNFKFTPENRKHKYSAKFLIIQSALWLDVMFEARSGGFLFQSDSDFGFLKLRPHPNTIIFLIVFLTAQIMILLIQQTNLLSTQTIVRLCRCLPRNLPGRATTLRMVRRYRERR